MSLMTLSFMAAPLAMAVLTAISLSEQQHALLKGGETCISFDAE